jgi:predicted MPP superfamily phosphohydrolase/uncharacterized membrane protein YhaH (DUF805 family)
MLVFFLTVVLISISMHLYFYYKLKSWLYAYKIDAKSYKRLYTAIKIGIVILILPFMSRFVQRMHNLKLSQWFFYLFVYPSVMYTYLVFSFSLIMILISPFKYSYRFVSFLVSKVKKESSFNPHRRELFKKVAPALPAFLLGYGIYGNIRSEHFSQVTTPVLKSPSLPAGLDGLKIVQITDVHTGLFMRKDKLLNYVKKINSLEYDILILTGDFIDSNIAYLDECVLAFKEFRKPKYGIHACMGNHDLYSGYEKISSAFKKIGINVLRNANTKLEINSEKVCIAGIEDLSTGKSDVDLALKGSVGAYKIVLCHQPYIFKEIADKGADLVLSGHTHGGQVNPLKIGKTYITFASLFSKYIAGFYKEGKSTMYVSKGIGVAGLPIRTMADPEITLLTLKKI